MKSPKQGSLLDAAFRSTLAVAFMLIAWPAFMFHWPTGSAFVLLAFALSRTYRGWLLVVLLSPACQLAALGVVSGVSGYVKGTAEIHHGMGVDHVTRARLAARGCARSSFQPFVEVPNNAAVRTLTALFGPMQGAYTGEFPTEEEAARMLQRPPEKVFLGPEDLCAELGFEGPGLPYPLYPRVGSWREVPAPILFWRLEGGGAMVARAAEGHEIASHVTVWVPQRELLLARYEYLPSPAPHLLGDQWQRLREQHRAREKAR